MFFNKFNAFNPLNNVMKKFYYHFHFEGDKIKAYGI